MKTVILAGGFGTRISEESVIKPKPMVEIGGKPILWHIMKIYAHYGFNDFIICLGYKGYVIKEYFKNYFLHMSDVTFDMVNNRMDVHRKSVEPWKVTLIDTGEKTLSGGRLKRVADYLEPDEPFFFTYGDGVANIDLNDELNFHKQHKKLATVCAVLPEGRFGALSCDGTDVKGFQEKPLGDGTAISGGFFVLQPDVINYIDEDQTSFERYSLKRLAENGQLSAYEHKGFWHSMDTLRDKNHLESIWQSGNPPWKIW